MLQRTQAGSALGMRAGGRHATHAARPERQMHLVGSGAIPEQGVVEERRSIRENKTRD